MRLSSGCLRIDLCHKSVNTHGFQTSMRLFAVLAHDREGILGVIATNIQDSYPSLTPECPQAHWFERELFEQWGQCLKNTHGLNLSGFIKDTIGMKHRIIIFVEPIVGVTDFFQLTGTEVHDVAVGPVHAGIIEPGHFRFQCHGENVYHLEISLGYQHRGVEPALIGGPTKRTIHYMETLAGDTTIGHATAYAHIMEALSVLQLRPDL